MRLLSPSLTAALGILAAGCLISTTDPQPQQPPQAAARPAPGQRCRDGRIAGRAVALCLDDVSWPEAARRCSQAGMRLLVIPDQATQREADNLLLQARASATDAPWIGLRKGSSGLEWVDGSPTAFQAFTQGEPNGGPGDGCIHMNWPLGTGTWNDVRCDAAETWSSYICEAIAAPAAPPPA
jgi:lectin-like protein